MFIGKGDNFMKDMKKLFLRIAFGSEILFILFFYLFGSNGLSAIKSGKQEVAVLQDKISGLETEKNLLASQLARNELQMANKNDQIYIN